MQQQVMCQTPGVIAGMVLLALGAAVLLVAMRARARWVHALRGQRPPFARIRRQAKRIVCLGDGLTRGSLSYDYVRRLAEHFANDDVQVFNAGVNGDLVHNLTARLDAVWELEPDVVVVMIGTMDTQVRFCEQARRFAKKHKQLPEQHSVYSFEHRYKQLLRTLYPRTKVMTATIPFLGEALDTEANREVRATNRVIRRVSWEFQVKCVRFHEELAADYARQRRYRGPKYDGKKVAGLIRRSAMKRHVFGQPWTQVSVDNHFWYLTDSVHINERAGQLLAKRLEEELRVELARDDQDDEPEVANSRPAMSHTRSVDVRARAARAADSSTAPMLVDASKLDLPMKSKSVA